MQEAIDELHFHPRWFDPQLLPDAFFVQQLASLRSGEDVLRWHNLEHHRWAAFKAILALRENLSDEQLEQYIALCDLDEDQSMADSALTHLLQWRGLTPEQSVYVMGHAAFAFPAAQKLIWRHRMRATLLLDPISSAAFSEISAKQDPTFERELVEAPNVSNELLKLLAENGTSRAVRNIAKNKLSGVNENWR